MNTSIHGSVVDSELLKRSAKDIAGLTDEDEIKRALYAFSSDVRRAAITETCSTFEQMMSDSVSLLFRPHIAGVASVVKTALLNAHPPFCFEEQANLFLQAQPDGEIACVTAVVVDATFEIKVTKEVAFENPDEVYPVNPGALKRIQHDPDNKVMSLRVYCAVGDEDAVVAAVKRSVSDFASVYAEQCREHANALDTLQERLDT